MPSSKYKGVRQERNRWRADIQIEGKKKFLGYYDTELEAAQKYDNAVDLYGLNRKKNMNAPSKEALYEEALDILKDLLNGKDVETRTHAFLQRVLP